MQYKMLYCNSKWNHGLESSLSFFLRGLSLSANGLSALARSRPSRRITTEWASDSRLLLRSRLHLEEGIVLLEVRGAKGCLGEL